MAQEVAAFKRCTESSQTDMGCLILDYISRKIHCFNKITVNTAYNLYQKILPSK